MTVDAFPIAMETTSEPPPPSALVNTNTITVKEPQTNEDTETQGEKETGEKEGGEGQWYVLLNNFTRLYKC